MLSHQALELFNHHRSRTHCISSWCLKSALCPSSNPFYPPKMCPGSRGKWVKICAAPGFSGHDHYKRSAETHKTQINQKVRLGYFLQDYCFTFWYFLFLLPPVFLLIFSGLALCFYFFSLDCFFWCISFQISLLLSAFLLHLHATSTVLLLFLFLWWATVGRLYCTDKIKTSWVIHVYLRITKTCNLPAVIWMNDLAQMGSYSD